MTRSRWSAGQLGLGPLPSQDRSAPSADVHYLRGSIPPARIRTAGHKNIQHTVRYTELAPDRFKNFWRD